MRISLLIGICILQAILSESLILDGRQFEELWKAVNSTNNIQKIFDSQNDVKSFKNSETQPQPTEDFEVPHTTPKPTCSCPDNQSSARSTSLQAVIATTLPFTLHSTSSVYDSQDCIYSFGGKSRSSEQSTSTSILQFNISSKTVVEVGNLPADRNGGVAVAVNEPNGLIFYFNYGRNIMLLNTTANSLGEIIRKETHIMTRNSTEDIMIVEGQTYVRNLSILDHQFQKDFSNVTFAAYRAAFVHGEIVTIFRKNSSSIEIVNLTSSTKVFKETKLPKFLFLPAVVTDGNYGYLIGGYENTGETPTSALIRFHPGTLHHEFIPVSNFPGIEGFIFKGTSAVYVKKLHRIYIIGGYSAADFYEDRGFGLHNKIWYIDLPSLEETETPYDSTHSRLSCGDIDNGLYPSREFGKYLGCINGTLEKFACPPPLSFRGETSTCNYPKQEDIVNCQNKTGGYHPYPRNCKFYIFCNSGRISRIQECKWWDKFDEVDLRCTSPEEARCNDTVI